MRLAAGRPTTLFSPAVAGQKKGAIGSERKKFWNVGGLRGRQKAPPACCYLCHGCQVLSSLLLSAYSGTSFVVKLDSGPRAVTYADTLRVIREPPWFLPYLDSTCSFVRSVGFNSFLFFFTINGEVRGERVLENSISSQVKRMARSRCKIYRVEFWQNWSSWVRNTSEFDLQIIPLEMYLHVFLPEFIYLDKVSRL